MKIYVGNLSPDITEEDLHKLFSRFGKVKNVRLFKYPAEETEGYGFIGKSITSFQVQSYISEDFEINEVFLRN